MKESLIIKLNLNRLPGNAAVLLGSIKYKALKMDKISLVLVQNIAAADMIIVLLRLVHLFSSENFNAMANASCLTSGSQR